MTTYRSPCEMRVQDRLNEESIDGYVRVSDLEITISRADEGAFIASLTTRLQACLDDMVTAAPDAVFFDWNWPK